MPRLLAQRRLLVGGLLLFAVGLAVYFGFGLSRAERLDLAQTVQVQRREFIESLQLSGRVEPVSSLPIKSQVNGTILSIVPDGERVRKGDLLCALDPLPHQEAFQKQEAKLRKQRAEQIKETQRLAKELRVAEDRVASVRLRLELEQVRLGEVQAGPLPADEINARNNIENAAALLEAKTEELQILTDLADAGYVARAEVRQKELGVREQQLKVAEFELAMRKLRQPDPLKLEQQRLAVREQEKQLQAALKQLELAKENLGGTQDRLERQIKAEERRLGDLKENLQKISLRAPEPGVVLLGKMWTSAYGPGREIWPDWQIMTLSDLRRMKAVFNVDEGRVAMVRRGQTVWVQPVGQRVKPFRGQVERIAEKGQDEFSSLRQETISVIGNANRQVFEVEVLIEEPAPTLRPGLRVEVEVELQRIPAALVVPRAAVRQDAELGSFVLLAQGGGASGAERKQVKVLARNAFYCAVSGLEDGERVWRVEPGAP